MKAKFSKGDPVRFTDKASNVADLRKRTRIIVACHYSQELQATLYELGANGGLHRSGQWFRSYELYPVNGNGHTMGRPKNRIRSKVRMSPPSRQTSHQTAKPIPHYLERQKTATNKANARQAQILITERGEHYNG